MELPDWYSNWRDEAFHQLLEKNRLLKEQYRLGDWPRYDYDLSGGTLIFSEDGVARVVAESQVAGTTSMNAGNWLWAWGNAHWPEQRTTDSALVRAFGEEHGICELAHGYVEDDDLNALGWELTAVMVRITNSVGAYRSPSESGALFLTYKSIAWAD